MMREIFSDADGRLSSKRIVGALAFVFSVALTIWIVAAGYQPNVLMYPYTLTAGLFGFGALEKRK